MVLRSTTRSAATKLLFVAQLVALVACGGRSDLSTGRSEREPPPTQPPTVPPTLPAPSVTYACEQSASTRPMLAVATDAELSFVYPDRTAQVVYNFDVPANHRLVDVKVKGFADRVAAQVISVEQGNGPRPATLHLVHLALDGGAMFETTIPYAYRNSGNEFAIHGRGDLIVHTAQLSQDGRMYVVDRNELLDPPFVRWGSRGAPDGSGRAVVLDFEGSSSAGFHFLNLRDGTSVESAYVSNPFPSAASSPATINTGEGTAIVYLRRNPSRVVVETAGGVREAPIAIDLPEDKGHLSATYQHAGPWVGFRQRAQMDPGPDGFVMHLVNGLTMETRSIPLDWPLSLDPNVEPIPSVDDTGAMIWRLEVTGKATQLWRTTDGKKWQALGEPFPEGTLIGGANVAGSTVHLSRRLIGPGDTTGYELDDGSLYPTVQELSPDGRCHAYYRDTTLRVVEVANYDDTAVNEATRERNAVLGWIPIP